MTKRTSSGMFVGERREVAAGTLVVGHVTCAGEDAYVGSFQGRQIAVGRTYPDAERAVLSVALQHYAQHDRLESERPDISRSSIGQIRNFSPL